MNKIFEAYLGADRKREAWGIRDFAENILKIHLGVSERCLLLGELRTRDYTCGDDIEQDIATWLWRMGYRSKNLQAFIEEDKATGIWAGENFLAHASRSKLKTSS